MPLESQLVIKYLSALGGTRQEDDYNEANKRHTMSYPPERIPDIENESPTKVKPAIEQEKKEKVKEKVCFFFVIKYLM